MMGLGNHLQQRDVLGEAVLCAPVLSFRPSGILSASVVRIAAHTWKSRGSGSLLLSLYSLNYVNSLHYAWRLDRDKNCGRHRSAFYKVCSENKADTHRKGLKQPFCGVWWFSHCLCPTNLEACDKDNPGALCRAGTGATDPQANRIPNPCFSTA